MDTIACAPPGPSSRFLASLKVPLRLAGVAGSWRAPVSQMRDPHLGLIQMPATDVQLFVTFPVTDGFAQANHFFEALAPKHAAKPPRSEIPEPGEASAAFDASAAADVNDAERRHLAQLNNSSEVAPQNLPCD